MKLMRASILPALCLALVTGCGSLHEAKPRVDVMASIPKDRAVQILQELRGGGALPKSACVLSEAGVRRNGMRAVIAYQRLYLHFYENNADTLVPFVADRESKPIYILPNDFYWRVLDGKYSGCTLGRVQRSGGQLPQAQIDKLATAWRTLGGKLGD